MSNQISPQKKGIKSDSASGDNQQVKYTHHLPDAISELVVEENSSEKPPGLDDIFDLLKNYRRRCVLEYLSDRDSTGSLSDIAEQIAGWENEKEPRLITSSERKRVYVGLYQSHLPKMDDMGAISFNKPRGEVEKGPYFAAFYFYLPTQEESSDSLIQGITERVSTIF